MPFTDFAASNAAQHTLGPRKPDAVQSIDGSNPYTASYSPDSERLLASQEQVTPVPAHPLGIKPLGNKYLANEPDAKLSSGSFQVLPDELVMHLLEHLDAPSLSALGYTCKFLFACSSYDDLWKNLALLNPGWKPSRWLGSWRATLKQDGREESSYTGCRHIGCGNVFSDVLHRPFVCSNIQLDRFASHIPVANQIARLGNLTYEEFNASWANTPFILTDCIRSWPVLRDWNLETIRKEYADTVFRAESVDWKYALYDQYMANTTDESPLYLFDRQFVEKMQLSVGRGSTETPSATEAIDATSAIAAPSTLDTAYWTPDCFGPDLFEVLGSERPAHRWLIVGPARSGSTFHKDPNGTSAWNAVICGAKYWVMFPPSAAVPGVFVSKDKSEVTSPLSIAEWLLEFHAEARQQGRALGCIEGICHAGEILHVPSGWWHLVVNLEPGIALTQNFVPKSHLADVLLFLRDRPEQVTGFSRSVPDPYGMFVSRLDKKHPDILREAQIEIERRDGRRKRTWDKVVGWDDDQSIEEKNRRRGPQSKEGTNEDDGAVRSVQRGFSFGFGFVSDDDFEDEAETKGNC